MNIRTYIDDELHIRPTSTKKLAVALQREHETLVAMRQQVEEDDGTLNKSHLGRALARLSDHLWLDGQHHEAIELGRQALDVWQELDRPKAAFLQRLKLAEYEIESSDGHDMSALEQLVEESESEPFAVYRDFALEALARRSFHAGEYDRALEAIEQALELRRERGNEAQIEQTDEIRRIILAARAERQKDDR